MAKLVTFPEQIKLAALSLANHPFLGFFQEACKIPGIGRLMAEKILEILESGHLRKLDHISENVSVLEVFSNVWGVGVKTAQMWYQQVFFFSSLQQ